jgi:hypothetical protein
VETGPVQRVTLDGKKQEILASGLVGPNGIAVDSKHVFVTTGDGNVLRIDL